MEGADAGILDELEQHRGRFPAQIPDRLMDRREWRSGEPAAVDPVDAHERDLLGHAPAACLDFAHRREGHHVARGEDGIGRGIALAFAAEGAKVAINFHTNEANAASCARQIRENGGEAEIYQGDVSDSARMREIFEAVVTRFGRLDVYVNNANAGGRPTTRAKTFLDVEEAQLYDRFFQSFKAAFVNGQMAARQMIAQGGGGRIINITSVHQDRVWPSEFGSDAVYGSMKAAINRLTMSEAYELAPHGIRANAIAPGFIDVRLQPGDRGEAYAQRGDLADREIPLGRGLPKDIADAAVFLASDGSRFVTGTCLLVDGGTLLTATSTV
jgi:NAD(P)-dependent dehydrogenase (short-subunit alcohol dehydrogenase family)